jgi:nicotinamidase-related amidase
MSAALLVIDMQNDFLRSWHADKRDALVGALADLVTLGRTRGWPIIWVRTEFAPDRSDAALEMRRKQISVVVQGSEGAAFPAGLSPAPGDPVIVKKRYSAFFGTDLDALLARLGVTSLVIAGVNTHACVRSTVIDAYQRDWEIVVARDCVGGNDEVHHEISLRYFDGKMGWVLTNPEIAQRSLAASSP